jgi:hypothetical protein
LELPPITDTVSLEPITHILSLQELTFPHQRQFSNAHIAHVKSMFQLERLLLSSTVEQFASLLQQPHSLQLHEICIDFLVQDDKMLALLPLLPSLTRLECLHMSCKSSNFLHGLRNLTAIDWSLDASGLIPPAAASLVDGLRLLPSVIHVSLTGARLSCAQLIEALSGMSLLQKLRLRSFPQLESLAFLSTLPSLAATLNMLHLDRCKHASLSSAELKHLLPLRSLRKLILTESFNEPLDSLSLTNLTPPSRWLPSLEDFQDYELAGYELMTWEELAMPDVWPRADL